MAFDLDDDELKATRILNGVDKPNKIENINELKALLKQKIASVSKVRNELLTDLGDGIKVLNVTGLSRKEKAELVNKRNCLIVQEYCYQEILDLLK